MDLSAFAGRVIYVRFLCDAVAPAMGAAPDVWRIGDVTIHIGMLR